MQEAWIRSLVRELDPTCHNERSYMLQLKILCARAGAAKQINKYKYKKPQTDPLLKKIIGFLGGSLVKNLPANTGDTGSIPDPRSSHMPRGN